MHTHHVRVDGDRLTKTYVSWDRDEHRREWEALNLLHDQSPGLAPEPLEAHLDQQPPQVVMSVAPGATPQGVWSDDQLRALGASLERLWSLAPSTIPPLPAVSAQQPSFWQTLLDAEQRPSGGQVATAFDTMRVFLAGLSDSTINDSTVRPVLGQGDPNRDNFLWDGTMITIVDFEDASASDLDFELANQVEHLANRHAGFEPLLERFEVDPERLLLCRRMISCFLAPAAAPRQCGAPSQPAGHPGVTGGALPEPAGVVNSRIWLVIGSSENRYAPD